MRRFGVAGAIAASVVLGLSACSGDDETGGSTDDTTSPAPLAAEAPADPSTGDSLPSTAAIGTAGGITARPVGLTGDAANGQRVFARCRACHATEPGMNRIGPSLHGIVGRRAGTIPNFRYSAANKASDVTWTKPVLSEYLENPRRFMPGTYMTFAGLRQPQQRADVIAYLETLS